MVEELESKTAHLEVAQAFRKRIGPPAAGDNSTTVEVPEALLRRAVYVLENTRRPISVEEVARAGKRASTTTDSGTATQILERGLRALGIEVEDGDA